MNDMKVGCTMTRTKLLEMLKKQRKEHVQEFKEAMNNWRTLMRQEAQKIVDMPFDDLKEFPPNLFQAHRVPAFYVEQIDEVISMLKHSTEKNIVLDQQDYRKLVLGHWTWKDDFDTSNTWYANALR